MLNVKEVSWKIVLFYLLVSMALVSLINLVLFPGHVFSPLTRATNNWIDATLQANLLNLAVFCVFLFVFGRLRPADVGLHWCKLSQGIFLTGLLWIAMQAGVLIVNWINGDIHINPSWDEAGVTVVLGGLIGQLLGNNAFSKRWYTAGFIFPSSFSRSKQKMKSGKRRDRFLECWLCSFCSISQTVFSLVTPWLIFR